MAIEKGGSYRGGTTCSRRAESLEGIGRRVCLDRLFARLKSGGARSHRRDQRHGKGEATALYLSANCGNSGIAASRIATGCPWGAGWNSPTTPRYRMPCRGEHRWRRRSRDYSAARGAAAGVAGNMRWK